MAETPKAPSLDPISIGLDVIQGVGNILDGGKAKRRSTRLGKDFAEAQARNNAADRDYLLYADSRGGDVTRYEYDKLRAPLESADLATRAASGLFPYSTAAGESAVTATSAVPYLVIGGALLAVIVLAVVLFRR